MISKEEFIKKAKELYEEQFDYKYITENNLENYSTIPVMCSKHGLFYTTVYSFLNGEHCFECKTENNKKEDIN